MNLPNKLTVLRVLLIPFFVFFLINSAENRVFMLIALAIFAIAALTDALDGYIARKENLITNFGKFMDPLADKLLVCSALICMIELSRISAAIVLVIIAREFIISGFRLVAADAGIVIAASPWGKSKTVVQMATVIFLILNTGLVWVELILIYAMLALTIISLMDYLIKNHKVITSGAI